MPQLSNFKTRSIQEDSDLLACDLVSLGECVLHLQGQAVWVALDSLTLEMRALRSSRTPANTRPMSHRHMPDRRYSKCMSAVCHLLRSGVAAIFGPQSGQTASHVQSICDTMEIPHLETRWDYRLRRESCLVNLYPHPTTLSKVSSRLETRWSSLEILCLETRLLEVGVCCRHTWIWCAPGAGAPSPLFTRTTRGWCACRSS